MTDRPPHSEVMTSRIPPNGMITAGIPIAPVAPPLPMRFNIIIPASDGTVLVHMTEDDAGNLHVTGDESRWDEGARRFLHGMMQWSGQVGIAWKDEVKKAAEEGGW